MSRARVVEVRAEETPAEVEARDGLRDGEAEDSSPATEPGDSSPAAQAGSPATKPGAGDETGRVAGAEPHATAEPAEATEGEAGADQATKPEPPEAADSEPAEAEAEAEPEPVKPRPAWLRLPALLLTAALILTGAGVWFTLEANSASGNPAAANRALTDVGATADVTSAVTLAMNRIFSYSYDKTDVTEKAAAAVLRGSAKDSYDKLFAQVRQKAPEQKLVLTSRVSAIAVQELRNGHARLLVFLDQSAVRADNNAIDSAAAQLSVTAERTGDGWVVTALEPR
jgi:Mce-associated membrane protein